MKKTESYKKIIYLLIPSIVIIGLIIVSIIQYKWIITSTKNDLIELSRNITFKIYKNISIEIESEFYPIRNLLVYKDIDDNSLEQKISEIYNPDFLSIGFYSKNKIHIYDGNNWSINDNYNLFNKNYGFLEPDELGVIKLLFPLSKERDLFIFFNFEDFYIKHNFDKDFDEKYKIKWIYTQPENSRIFNDKDYFYSPLNTIKNRLLKKENRWIFGILLYMDILNDRNFVNPRLIVKPRLPEPQDSRIIYLDIISNNKSLIDQKEDYITIQWFFTIFILLSLGASYILILNQVFKLKQLREKEKIFVASVTHELRTPLTVINSAGDNIAKGFIKDKKLEQYGYMIKNESQRLSAMVEGILLFSRLEGRSEKTPNLKPVDLNLIKEHLQMNYPTIEIDMNIKKIILSDFESLLHVLTNLIQNALTHAYSSECFGSIRLKTHIQLPGKLIFTVEDDGTGITQKDQKQIFKPFYRGKKSYLEQVKGSGLGLFIAYNRARLLHGQLKVESPYERLDGIKRPGSKFTLTLPYIEFKEDNNE